MMVPMPAKLNAGRSFFEALITNWITGTGLFFGGAYLNYVRYSYRCQGGYYNNITATVTGFISQELEM